MIRPVLKSGKPNFTGIKEITEQSFGMYPNPASNSVQLIFDSPGEKTIHLLDLTGRSVLIESTDAQHLDWNLEQIPAGIYLVHVITSNGQSVQRLVKQ